MQSLLISSGLPCVVARQQADSRKFSHVNTHDCALVCTLWDLLSGIGSVAVAFRLLDHIEAKRLCNKKFKHYFKPPDARSKLDAMILAITQSCCRCICIIKTLDPKPQTCILKKNPNTCTIGPSLPSGLHKAMQLGAGGDRGISLFLGTGRLA